MVYHVLVPAPSSQLPEERRGRVLGRFCHVCSSVYPLHRGKHAGKPSYGRDHIASPCAHEGELFEPGASWWELAVEALPPPVVPVEASAPAPAAKAG